VGKAYHNYKMQEVEIEDGNILFAVTFDGRHRGRGVRAAAVHPGRKL